MHRWRFISKTMCHWKMMRSSCRCLLDTGVASFPPMLLRDELLLTDWPTIQKELDMVGTSVPVAGDDYFRQLQIRGGQSRISAMFFVTIGDTSRWIPAIVDTGAHRALHLSKDTLASSFNCNVVGDDITNASGQNQGCEVIASIGRWRGAVQVTPPLSAASGAISEPNIVGMGMLEPEIANEVGKIFSRKFRHVEPLVVEFLVTDGTVAFRVTPKHQRVMDLKAAIKEYMMYQIPPPLIIIKDPSGTVLGDKDPLHAGVEYTYELPPDSVPGEVGGNSPMNRSQPCQVLVEFKRRRVLQFESPLYVAPGEYVVVGGDRGEDIGLVTHSWAAGQQSTAPEHVAKWARVGLGKVLRVASVLEVSQLQGVQTELETRAVEVAQKKVEQYCLLMGIVDAEYQFDRKKLTFYYKGEEIIDFRDLVRDLYKTFRARDKTIRIWMERVG